MLDKIGIKTQIAGNGREALDEVLNNDVKYDLILMDVQMPVMNGLDATRELRANHVDIPIVAMTANAMKGDREICIEAGMNDYIGKPVKMDDLTRLIDKWM